MSLEKRVIDNIKRIRKEKGISQEKLAEACGTATSYIGLMEIYRNVPKLSTIERIARALGVDPLVFFQDSHAFSEEKEAALLSYKNDFLSLVDKELNTMLHSLAAGFSDRLSDHTS
jgi:transcriptional regulator with XRE-family HTH domain